jgi:CRP-like cAMP-binding protein
MRSVPSAVRIVRTVVSGPMHYLEITPQVEGLLQMPPDAIPADDPRRNKLLAAIPNAEWSRVQRNLEPIEMPLGKIVCESGSQLRHVYFPTTSTVSLAYVTADGASTEIAAVGNEGAVGIALFMGGDTMPGRAVVQTAGWAHRLRRESLKEEFARGGAMQRVLLLYTQVRLTLLVLTAVCNQHHSIEQQLIRWLLLTLDRLASQELTITHELIANILGVRRGGITEAAGKLQHLGLIASSRGRITVVDRAGLEARCCECYRVVRREYDRLLGSVINISEEFDVLRFREKRTPRCSADGSNCTLR